MYTKEILKCENNTLERKKPFLQSLKTLPLKIFQLRRSCRINVLYFISVLKSHFTAYSHCQYRK